MARIILTQTKASFGAVIRNYFMENGVLKNEANTIYPEDTVTNLSFVKDSSVVKLTGRVSDINVEFNKATNENVDTLLTDAKVVSITVDHSVKNKGAIDIVPANEIIDYNTDKEVSKVSVEPTMKVDFLVKLSDNTSSSATLKVGDFLTNVKIIGNGEETVGDYTISSFCYNLISNGRVKVTGMVLKGSSFIFVPFEAIKYIGKEAVIVNTVETAELAIDTAMTTGGSVKLSVMNYNKAITADTINLSGFNANVKANEGNRRSDNLNGETLLTENVTIKDGADVTFNGLTFNGNNHIIVNKANSVTFKNCKFVGNEPYQSKSYLVYGNTTDEPVLYQFEGCYFGSNKSTSSGKQYNAFELNSKIADGSYIRDCYFAKACCTHNQINIYEVEDGAKIDISGNHFEMSSNAIRVGIKGNKHCLITANNNIIDETDTDPDWGGLVLFQPYGTLTESFENVVMEINNLINNTGNPQIGYIYYTRSSTHITEEKEPKTYVNGQRVRFKVLGV